MHDTRQEVYQCLGVMMEEKNSNTFKTMAQNFVEKYSKDCSGFINYFQDNYLNRPEKWAMCFRNFDHAKTDTNTLVEAYHNSL